MIDKVKPIVFDLFCGLGGWSEAFIAEGYRAIGFDIEKHDYGDGGYPGELVLRDVRSITGAEIVKQYGVPNVIVASPPCQEFSYMAMPWSKAKEKMRKILADPAEQTRLTDLFNQCFRIQREVSAAAGHYVPMIVENVRGAQRWVGKARWNFGSFYLWGDVPALMPIPSKVRMKSKRSCAPLRFDERIASTPQEAAALHYRLPKGEKGFKRNSRFNRATGQVVPGGIGDASDFSSKSSARKKSSAEIAKIPPALAAWIAKTFK
jgi:site-specific DNA-cytosine methylase